MDKELQELLNSLDLSSEALTHNANQSAEWTTVKPSSRSKGRVGSSPDSRNQVQPEPIPTPLTPIATSCPYKIYQIPSGVESVAKLVTDVVGTGFETKRLFDEVVNEVYPKLVILLRGAPGCGKSSVSKAVVAVTPSGSICSADDYFMDSRGVYQFNASGLPAAHDQCRNRCRILMNNSISPIIIDNTNTRRFEMEGYVKLAIQYNYEVKPFHPETSWNSDAKVLAKKNTHNVPKAKINEMLQRYEQVLPRMLVNDVRKTMGEVGKQYNPVRREIAVPVDQATKSVTTPTAEFAIGFTPTNLTHSTTTTNTPKKVDSLMTSFTPPSSPKLFEFLEHGLSNPNTSRKGTLNEGSEEAIAPRIGHPRMAAVFPSESNNEKGVGGSSVCSSSRNLMDQNLFSTGRSRRRPSRSGLAVDSSSSPVSNDVGNPNTRVDMTEADETFSKSAELLFRYFPSCPKVELLKLLKLSEGDVDYTINSLLDSGYEMSDTLETLQTLTAGPSPAEELTRSVDTTCENGASDPNSRARYDSPPNDGEDWFDLELSPAFVSRLTELYGNVGDINAMSLPKELRTIRVPPSMAFDFYRFLNLNVEKREYRAAEETSKD